MVSGILEAWWTDKYNLPPSDVRFTAQTEDALYREFYQDMSERRQTAVQTLEQLTGATASERKVYLDQIAAYDLVLGAALESSEAPGSSADDQLAASWESKLKRGEAVDLSEGLDPKVLDMLSRASARNAAPRPEADASSAS